MHSENSGNADLFELVSSQPFRSDFLEKLIAVIKARRQGTKPAIDDQDDSLDIHRQDIRRALEGTLKKHMFSKIPPPYPVTIDEIFRTAFAELANLQLKQDNYERIRKAWGRFLTSLDYLVDDGNRGDDIPLGEWKLRAQNPDDVLGRVDIHLVLFPQ